MKFMMLIKADEKTESGAMPDEKVLVEMGKYNDELVKAGVLLAAEGLHPSSKGARIHYQGGKSSVTDGPFAEAKELIAGFWIIQVKSKEEALQWARRIPYATGEVELRQVFEMSDFTEDLYQSDQARAVLESEQAFREKTGQL